MTSEKRTRGGAKSENCAVIVLHDDRNVIKHQGSMTDRKKGRREKKSGVYKRFLEARQHVPAAMHAIPQVSNIAICLARCELVRLIPPPT